MDENIVKIMHIRNNEFLVCYRSFVVDLIDIEQMYDAMSKPKVEEEKKVEDKDKKEDADMKSEEGDPKPKEKPKYLPIKHFSFSELMMENKAD